jgi:hypothetical protein
MIATSKQSLISKSVAAIRIGVHPAVEEPDQHIIRVAPQVSRLTTFHKVPTRLKSGLCSRDEIFVPSNHPTRPLS